MKHFIAANMQAIQAYPAVVIASVVPSTVGLSGGFFAAVGVPTVPSANCSSSVSAERETAKSLQDGKSHSRPAHASRTWHERNA